MISYTLRKFSTLSTGELFGIYRLRAEIFVVEQNCAYQDVDDKDPEAWHLMMYDGDALVGYCRILPPGLSYPEPSIGRVAVVKSYRGRGAGKDLMRQSIRQTHDLYPQKEIVISAQTYLIPFYTALGFVAEGQGYDEDAIPHIRMRLGKK